MKLLILLLAGCGSTATCPTTVRLRAEGGRWTLRGSSFELEGRTMSMHFWSFARRHNAVVFARRRGIEIVETT